MEPVLEEAVLSFDCPPHYVLVGPNTTVCIGNGEWKPDPREVKCKVLTTLSVYYAIIIVITSFTHKYFNLYGKSAMHPRH